MNLMWFAVIESIGALATLAVIERGKTLQRRAREDVTWRTAPTVVSAICWPAFWYGYLRWRGSRS